jgi:hypothetical protein
VLGTTRNELTIKMQNVSTETTLGDRCLATGTDSFGGKSAAIGVGRAAVHQNGFHISLWSSLDPNDDDAIITVNELPVRAEPFKIRKIRRYPNQQAITYCWRLEAKIGDMVVDGPFSGPVSFMWPEPMPEPPPTFTIVPLGFDYYQRLLLRVVLPETSSYKPSGLYEVFWAPFSSRSDALETFESLAVPGWANKDSLHRFEL